MIKEEFLWKCEDETITNDYLCRVLLSISLYISNTNNYYDRFLTTW